VGRPLRLEEECVVYSYWWPSPPQSFSDPKSRGTLDHILLSRILGLPSLQLQVPVFISCRNRGPQLYPQGTGFPFRRLLRLARLRWRYSNRLHTRSTQSCLYANAKSQSHVTTDCQSVSQYALMSSPFWFS
jgi:hypothetical protein